MPHTYLDIPDAILGAGQPLNVVWTVQMSWNMQAIAGGHDDAPKIAVDLSGKTALATDNTDTTQVLRPDGTGGVVWSPDGAVNNEVKHARTVDSKTVSLSGLSSGVWHVTAHGRENAGEVNIDAKQHGLCVVSGGSIAFQSTGTNDSSSVPSFTESVDRFSLAGGVLSWESGVDRVGNFRVLVASRVK